ncbi:Uncharacterised protein [Mycobacteroides abscessus subsp. abscessus]|nr:Uncharacterised protein [Mycobacteroides abscessus subsp. abscessus]SKU71150.1 Uncharacterised protein [Mycobacteroides abscessus subsp. abscessus]
MGCTQTVAGTATWPGARIAQSLLTADELPEGTKYDRVVADLGPMTVNSQSQQVVVGGMPSNPQGCADGLSPRLANAGKAGPENTARYIARFNGANIIVSLLRHDRPHQREGRGDPLRPVRGVLRHEFAGNTDDDRTCAGRARRRADL